MRTVITLVLFAFLLSGCGPDSDTAGQKAGGDEALLQAIGVKEAQAEKPASGELKLEIEQPKFAEKEPEIRINVPKRKGSSLDF